MSHPTPPRNPTPRALRWLGGAVAVLLCLEMTDGTITLTTKLFKVNAPISVFEGNVDVAMSVHAGVNIIAANSVAALNGGVVLEAHQHTDVTSGDDKTGYPG